MIRHPVTATEFRNRITTLKPDWFTDTRSIIAGLPANPVSDDFPGKWGEIKTIYMELQGERCIYCEMPIEGNISNDVEHFRPKVKVRKWRVPRSLRDAGVNPTALVNDREDPGYHRLAYQPLNYAASCKFCNTSLKRNYFPIAAAWKTDATTVTQARTEDAYLIYPIGTVDRDPEAVIEFHGVFPQARAADGSFEHQRALVTIELFSLDNDRRRKSLFASRARSLAHLHSRLREQTNAATDDDRRDAEWWIDLLTDRQQPHANCMRCFKRLYERDKDEARTLVRDARRYVARMSGRTS